MSQRPGGSTVYSKRCKRRALILFIARPTTNWAGSYVQFSCGQTLIATCASWRARASIRSSFHSCSLTRSLLRKRVIWSCSSARFSSQGRLERLVFSLPLARVRLPMVWIRRSRFAPALASSSTSAGRLQRLRLRYALGMTCSIVSSCGTD